MIEEDSSLINAELIIAEKEIKDLLNNDFSICCPMCHSTDYEIYPTGTAVRPKGSLPFPSEDIHWKCNRCNKVWRSGFLKCQGD